MDSIISERMKATRARSEMLTRAIGIPGGMGDGNPLGLGTGGGNYGFGVKRTDLTIHQEQYRHNTGWVAASIGPIAKRIARQPIRLARVKKAAPEKGMPNYGHKVITISGQITGNPKPWEKSLGPKSRAEWWFRTALPGLMKQVAQSAELIDTHPILEAIDSPNPIMVRWSLMFVTVASLMLTGKAYWWVKAREEEHGQDSDPATEKRTPKIEIWPLPSNWVKPVHTEERLNDHWEVTPDGALEPTPVPQEQIVYFYFPDPAALLGAQSPLQNQSRAVISDEAIAEAQRRGFANGVFPGVAVVVGRAPDINGAPGERPTLNRDQRAQIITAFKQAYRGVYNHDEPIILDQLIQDVKRITNTNREMDFQQSGAYTKERITQGFGTSPAIMGDVSTPNKASSAAADDHFCFRGDTKILTDFGMVEISSVRVGMKVLTHLGRWKKVTKLWKSEFRGGLRKIQFIGSPDSVYATPNHPFLTGDGKWLRADNLIPVGANKNATARCVLGRYTGEDSESDPLRISFARSRGVGSEHHILDVKINDSVAWSLGHYMAEGYKCPSGIAVSTHRNEASFVADKWGEAFDRYTGNIPIVRREAKSANGAVVKISGSGISDFMSREFGASAKTKKIPGYVYLWPTLYRREFVHGYLFGDGYRTEDTTGYTTCSPDIAYGIRHLIADLGKRAVVKSRIPQVQQINGKRLKSVSVSYEGRINNGDLDDGLDSRLSLSVKSNESEPFVGQVYNLSVADDQSYTLGMGLVVHNCNNTVNPIIELISQTLTAWLNVIMGDPTEKLYLFIEEARAVDPDSDRSDWTELWSAGACSKDELRAGLRNLPPMIDGDTCLVDATKVVIDARLAADVVSGEPPRPPKPLAPDSGANPGDSKPIGNSSQNSDTSPPKPVEPVPVNDSGSGKMLLSGVKLTELLDTLARLTRRSYPVDVARDIVVTLFPEVASLVDAVIDAAGSQIDAGAVKRILAVVKTSDTIDIGGEFEIPVKDVRQNGAFDCGAAASFAAAEALGCNTGSYSDFVSAIKTEPEFGTEPDEIFDYFAHHGCNPRQRDKQTIEAIRTELKKGRLVICPVQYFGDGEVPNGEGGAETEDGHYILVNGFTRGGLKYHCPLDGPGEIGNNEFVGNWYDKGQDGKPYVRFMISAGPCPKPITERSSKIRTVGRINGYKLVDANGHAHDNLGRFGSGGGSGGKPAVKPDDKPGGDTGKPAPHAPLSAGGHDTGSVGDKPEVLAKKADGILATLKQHGAKAVAVAKKIGEVAKHIAIQGSYHAMTKNLADDICDTSHDYSKIINAKGTGDWLSEHLGVSGNLAAKVSSVALSYGYTKLKEHIKRRHLASLMLPTRSKDDTDTQDTGIDHLTIDQAAQHVTEITRALWASLGCPENELPTLQDITDWLAKRHDPELESPSQGS